MSHKYAVIYTETNQLYQTFENRSEAEHCVTDCFGPEWNTVKVVELEIIDNNWLGLGTLSRIKHD